MYEAYQLRSIELRNFEKRRRQFDKDFESARRWVTLVSTIALIFTLGLGGFGIWVIIVLLRFFGVI